MIKPRLIFNTIKAYLDSPEAIIVTGMRRTGKTTLLKFIDSQIASKNKAFLDLENPLNRKYFEERNYERIKFSFESLGIDFTSKPFIFLDEIQFVKNLPSVVKYFIDHYQVKFFLTASASFYLKNLFTESLSGRKYIFELFPLCFSEFLLFKGSSLRIPENARHITQPIFDEFSLLYDEYIKFGAIAGQPYHVQNYLRMLGKHLNYNQQLQLSSNQLNYLSNQEKKIRAERKKYVITK